MESKFIKELYLLSTHVEMLIFFDRIKSVFSKWIDKHLKDVDYTLELFEDVDQYHTSWVSIKIGYNRQVELFEKNEKFNDINNWQKFAEKFENKFESIKDNKRLKIDLNGDVNIFSH